MTRTNSDAYVELLVLRAQDGDHRALCALVDHWQVRLSRHALRLTGDGEAAAEVMQEAWLAVVRSLRRLDDPACFRTWAYRIVTNKCADWVRRRARGRADTRPLDHDPAGEDRQPAELREEIAALRQALAQLPPERRAILAMFYLDDLSIRDIAEAFSLPVGTVKSRLFHARNHLKQVLARREG